ncbi:hypothetical protein K435DRAFT_856854 [Dendrothele bispora CBS 962.96]|uniref:Arrestin-like N-terminal domain-containing protein n=1 Tax=Dendrothele bispora (strain CBS 962.96) TaxID=1314807 RepID=A0A4V4HGC1_DENBC|nr:hypothetical protein K435DRAFT_856854 [Dendrothele bispora CBS 962.96]
MEPQLPSYSPSSSSPPFSTYPGQDERTLLRTEGIGITATGTFTKQCGNISITLTEQEDGAEVPVYPQRGVVAGSVDFANTSHICEVTLKFQGRLRLSVTGSNASTSDIKILNEAFVLFSSTENSTCPRSIPFSVIFPSTFSDGTRELSMPPSYEVTFTGIPGLYANSEYNLKVVVKYSKALPWNKQKNMIVPLFYKPRKRPPQPMTPTIGFLSSMKISPEEWYQTTAILKSRPGSQLSPLETHFILPSVRSFGLSDRIPFHIQVIGPLSSLRTFLSHLSTRQLVGAELNRPKDPHVMIMSVLILREVYVEVNRQVVYKHCVVGRGELRAIPPRCDSSSCNDSDDREEALDWEGEVKCNDCVKVGHFDAGKVAVKEFLVFSIQAGLPMQSTDFLSLRNAVPISLVTDTWNDGNVYDF